MNVYDYPAFNKIIIKNNYFLPHINNILDPLNGTKYFSWFELKLRYYQIWITKEDGNVDNAWFLWILDHAFWVV
jgi:hypothetical protein